MLYNIVVWKRAINDGVTHSDAYSDARVIFVESATLVPSLQTLLNLVSQDPKYMHSGVTIPT